MSAAEIRDVYPLSPMQEGLLFHAAAVPASRAYVVQMQYELAGELDEPAFVRAWEMLVERHDVLRTAFLHEGLERPVQAVFAERRPEVRVEDLRALDEAARARAIDAYVAGDRERGFDLRRDVLVRLALFRIAADRHRFVWSYHHLVLDGWCLGILAEEFAACYAAALAGGRPELPAARPYRAYIEWLEARDEDAARAYWSRALEGYDQLATIPAEPAGAGLGAFALELSPELTADLGTVAARLRVTLGTLVQTLWGRLLAAYADRDDVVLGAVVSGRPPELDGVERIVGPFINAVPVRVRFDRSQTVADVVRGVQGAALEALAFHHARPADVGAACALGRIPFDHVLVFDNYPASDAGDADGLTFRALAAHDRTHFALSLVVVPGRRLRITFEYDRAVHGDEQIRRIAGGFATIAGAAAARPDLPFAELPLLDADEERRLLRWGSPPAEDRAAATVVERLAAQAARTPDALALVDGARRLTYRELHAYANALAALLADRYGVAPNERVGILIERSAESVVALLAVLAAGGAYVPLEPGWPSARIAAIVREAGCRAIVTSPRCAAFAPAGVATIVLPLAEPLPAPRPPVSCRAADLAYVLFTSGTTGEPKGCEIEHGSLAFYLDFADRAYGEATDVANAGLFSPLAFDLTVTSAFLPLVRGGTLTVLPPEADPESTLAAVFDGRHGIDVVKLTPSHLALLEHVELAASPVRLAIVGGEAFVPQHARLLRRHNPAMRIVNEYGPTEATVGCIVADVVDAEQPTPIGRPIPGARVAILDRYGRLQPIGAPGELYLGGPGLARGYRNRPDLTRERFVDVAIDGGMRMYRTGDFGCWLPDGTIAYAGRRDEQVKIRGHRVELGEIERALAAFDGISAAAVVAAAGALTAFYEGRPAEAGALRAFLRERLIEAMIPSRFVRLERLPRTPNGKCDKQRLLELAPGADGAAAFDSLDPAEREVAAIWSDVLGTDRFGRDESFFDVGGHSLRAMQVLARLRKGLGVSVDLRAFLLRPTVAALAEAVRGASPHEERGIPRAAEREDYELSHAQARLWLLHELGGNVAYNMPAAYRLDGELDPAVLRCALSALIERHAALRTEFVVVDGSPRQRVRRTVELPLRELDLRGDAEPDAAAMRFVEADAAVAFALDRAPLVRFTLLRTGDRRYVLALVLHHIVGDGWSMNVIGRDLLETYAAIRDDRTPALPALRLRYVDVAEWQRSRDWSPAETYWADALRNVPESLPLPVDRRPAAAGRSFRGDTVRTTLTSRQSERLRAAATERGGTLASIVLAAYALALWRLTRAPDFLIGLSVANRDDVDVEPLVGFFVNVLPIRFELDAAMRGRDLLDRTVRRVYDAFDHREYPFDELVRRFNPDRVANRQPLLNVVFGFQNFRDVRPQGAAAAESGAALDAALQLEVPFRTAKFDLCLFASDVADGLALELEYDGDAFDRATAERILAAVAAAAGAVSERAEDPLGSIAGDTSPAGFAAALAALNDTQTPYPQRSIPQLFAEIVRRRRDAVAIRYRGRSTTYGELDRRSNDVAAGLLARGIAPEAFVGVLVDRSPEMIAALLGILKAGAAYVPLDAELPYDRLAALVADTGTPFLIAEKRYVRTANKLLWDCPDLAAFVCLDSDDARAEIETGGLMDAAIWDYVSQEAFDDISGGGWTDSYTGEWLSRDVMDGYGQNIETKLAPLLRRGSRVLEIGCASGISMFRLAPLVETYVGTDISPGIIAWSQARAAEQGCGNVRLHALAAHEIGALAESDFDVVILNSVIECFSGHNYLRDVLRKALALMRDDGYLFLGNVWDRDLKAEFAASLREFVRAHPERAERTKLDRSEELFLSRDFIEDLRYDFPEIAAIDYSPMLDTAESELSRFGFDALLRIRKSGAVRPAEPRRKAQLDRRLLDANGGAPVPERSGPGSLAYMMYTSGTSGTPKGVLVEHRAIVRLVRDTDYIALGESDAVLQTGALGFDASTFELWGPLLNGGVAVVPEGKSFLHPADLGRLIESEGVTTVFLTTRLFNELVDLNPAAFAQLRTLLTGGEKASLAHFRRLARAYPELRLLHVYGPTENTTFSTWYQVTGRETGDVPIGRPIANSTALVVDDRLRPLPPGSVGELLVGGDGLARGYWNDARLTAQKFVPHPLDATRRVYRTGDLVRWLPDGELDFVGRNDTQTKIRGHRIELEELERVLQAHPAVTGAAVVAGDFGRGEVELAAFVTGRELEIEDLQQHVRRALPDYFVPGNVIVVAKLPLNANGKVDRRQLIVPNGRRERTAAVAAASDLERQLADIWQRLLTVSEIGVTDNFFRLGGHSIKVVRMASMIRSELGFEVPINAVFRAPTIRELAAYLADSSTFDRRLVDDVVVALNDGASDPNVFAFPPGSGYCVSYLGLAARLPCALFGLNFIEAESRLAEYVELIRAAADPPYVLFGYSGGGKIAFRVAQELERNGLAVRDVVMFDTARYLRPVTFTDAEIEDAAAEFLGELTSRVLREQALERMRAYRRFIGRCVESGTIAANLHHVVAERSEREVCGPDGLPLATLDRWDELTTGTFREHRGSGSHREMLQPGFLERNLDLLRGIIRSMQPA